MFSGYIALPDGTLLIEPIPTVHKFYSPNKHILYRVEDIKPSKTKATCGSHNFTKEPFDVHRQFQYLSSKYLSCQIDKIVKKLILFM